MKLKALITLPTEVVLKALEGQKNILTQAEEDSQELFRRLRCPYKTCHGEVRRQVNERQLFKPDELLPSYLACCTACGCVFEPHTGIIIKLGVAP